MPEIGATLREARMRQHIDIADVEARTKIRAKYLRALENEEWDLLPGPTYVKSFLRTYAEDLGLDARLMVEEFKLRHERLADHELLPITPGQRERERARRSPPGMRRDVLVALVVVALIALLIVLGRNGGGSSNKSSPNTVASAPVTTTAAKAPAGTRKKKAAPRFARLKLQPTGSVWVCVLAAGARKLEPGVVIGPTDTLPTWRSSHFVMTFGNGDLTMRVNGRTLAVPAVSKPIGYEVTRSGKRHVLPAAQQPTCS